MRLQRFCLPGTSRRLNELTLALLTEMPFTLALILTPGASYRFAELPRALEYGARTATAGGGWLRR